MTALKINNYRMRSEPELDRLWGALMGALYWHARSAKYPGVHFGRLSFHKARRMRRLMNKYGMLRQAAHYRPELTEYGNIIKRSHCSELAPNYDAPWVHIETYQEPYCWAQYHPEKLVFTTYCEGDITRVYCKNSEGLKREVLSAEQYYTERGA